MTIHTHISGILFLTSPLHCATTDTWGLDNNDRPVHWKTKQNLIGTTQQHILAGDQRRYTIPYFPANDLRGRLRRKAASIVLEALMSSQGTPVPVALYAGLNTGSASANPENDLTVEEATRAAKHVYMGVFGGGTRILKSRFSVQDAVPVLQSTIDIGMVPEGIGAFAEGGLPSDVEYSKDGETSTIVPLRDGKKLMDVRHTVRVDDTMRVLRTEEMEKYIADCASAVTEYQQKIIENRKQRKEEKESAEYGEKTGKIDTDNVVSVQTIIPGTSLYFRLDMVDSLSQAQIGLLASALVDMFNEQALGGWVRAGFGKFDAKEFNLTIGGEPRPFLKGDAGCYELTDEMKPYLDAMRDELSNLTVSDLMEFFNNRKPTKEEKKAAKKAKEQEPA